jgi:tartrate dehydrogenase/decarboxylase/D-malate dehydrogenase
MVLAPQSLDVVVASNLFGDILTDIGAALQGGMGMAASANIAPGASVPGIFEPVHGSAPDIVGRGIANPIGAIWGAAMMLEHLGDAQAAQAILDAIAATCAAGPTTPDIGGSATTAEVGAAIADHVRSD